MAATVSGPDMFPTEILCLPRGMSRDHPESHSFAITVRYRGTYIRRGETESHDWYSVEHSGAELSRAGNWKYCVERFQRWQYRHRFEDAVDRALGQVDRVTVAGRTWAEWSVA